MHSRSVILWLLLVVLALIVYGSLYPFNFKADAIHGGVFEALHQLSWARAGRGDRISNVLLYLPLGFCLFLWLETRWPRATSMIAATVLGTLLSLSIEVAQVYISARVPSFWDVTLNAVGTLLGVTAGLAWGGLTRLMHLPGRADKPLRDPGAMLLLGLWLAWRFAPFIPQFDLVKLKAALQPLFSPQFDPVIVFSFLTFWLVVNQAVAAVVSRPRRLEALLLVIATVLVGRLLVANQSFLPGELLALLLLLPMLLVMHRLRPRRAVLVFALIVVMLIDGLAPFDFAPPMGRFDLWPFLGWFEIGLPAAIQLIDWSELFGKLFLYGALLWVIKEWGASIGVAVLALVVTVLAIELLQAWLPEQNASITDPLLALGVGLAFRSLYQRMRPRAFARETIFQRVRNR
ncbi:MAG TPA: VanZ family protein [Steroidobacteraceae bacterium]|nr:VanZ family protein [Steroidobacteraceae bacterium]